MQATEIRPYGPEWKSTWATHLHGSDVAAILGHRSSQLAPTALDVWARLTGNAVKDDEPGEAALWGQRLEPLCAQRWTELVGEELVEPEFALVHPELPFLIVTPDRWISDGKSDEPAGVWEGKTASAWKASEWDGGMPIGYQVQLQTYMAACGLDRGAFGALIGGQKYVWEPHVPVAVEFRAQLVDVLGGWWDRHVERGNMPEPVGDDLDSLRRMLPSHADGRVVRLDEVASDQAERYASLVDEIRVMERERDAFKARLMAAMGTAEEALVQGADWRISWRAHERCEKPRAGKTLTVRPFRILGR